ncbi:MBL fold metallo-hydrolase [Thalassotalea atypica]|uniref:MBL fold metallo-hydrolase n=1 Tax=Thalassotalea atypica TaxID=2054316 RepID=UPI0025727DF9|nr:MBL fold metallo-hydrolase [Thalassotalea atypica]
MFKPTLLTLSFLGLFLSKVLAADTNFDFSVTHVTKNVYSIISPSYGRPSEDNKGWNSNSHFVVTEKGVLVFDTGSSELIGNGIIKAIKSVTEQPIRWVVNSHSHADHWLGNAAFAKQGAEIYSTGLSIAAMKEDGQGVVDAFSRMTEGATGTTDLSYPTAVLAQKEKRNLGGVNIEFIFANSGHSPGDVLVWLPEQQVIMGGDVLSSNWLPIMTPRGNVPNLIDTLSVVASLNPTIVLPGHGEITTVKSVVRDAKFLDSVWQLVKQGHEKDKEFEEILSQVENTLGPTYKTQYKDFDTSSEYLVQMIYKKQESL